MSITITSGWWLLPFAISVLAFGLAIAKAASLTRNTPRGGDYNFGAAFDGLLQLLLLGAATIVSLIAWLAWAIL